MRQIILLALAWLAVVTPALPCFYGDTVADRKETNIENEFLYAFDNKYDLKTLEICFRNFPHINFTKKNILDGVPAIHIALSHQPSPWQDQVIPWLISKGADIHARDRHGYTPLMTAAQNASPKTVAALIRAGARVTDQSKRGTTALHLVSSGNCKSVSLLVKAGAQINALEETGATPLLIAVSGRQVECVKNMILMGADVNLADKDGITPLMEAARKGSGLYVANVPKNRTAIAKILLEAKAEVNAATPDGVTALLFAASTGDTETVKLLLKHGADKSAVDSKGKTALAYAQANKHKAIIELLAN